jgi:hypothetical protein
MGVERGAGFYICIFKIPTCVVAATKRIQNLMMLLLYCIMFKIGRNIVCSVMSRIIPSLSRTFFYFDLLNVPK